MQQCKNIGQLCYFVLLLSHSTDSSTWYETQDKKNVSFVTQTFITTDIKLKLKFIFESIVEKCEFSSLKQQWAAANPKTSLIVINFYKVLCSACCNISKKTQSRLPAVSVTRLWIASLGCSNKLWSWTHNYSTPIFWSWWWDRHIHRCFALSWTNKLKHLCWDVTSWRALHDFPGLAWCRYCTCHKMSHISN